MSHGPTQAAAGAAKKSSGFLRYKPVADAMIKYAVKFGKGAVTFVCWLFDKVVWLIEKVLSLFSIIPGPLGWVVKGAAGLIVAGLVFGTGCTVVGVAEKALNTKPSSSQSAKVERGSTASKASRTAREKAEGNNSVVPIYGQEVEQLGSCTTNPVCVFPITGKTHFETNGESIWVLPPDWPKDQAVKYTPREKMNLRGREINPGEWTFWSVSGKPVLIRFTSGNY
jgi:hypothetical protein